MRPEPDLTCAQLVELVTDYLGGNLDDGLRNRVEAHLEACHGCNAYVEQMRATIAASGRLSEDDLAPELQERLLAAFRDWRANQ